MSINWVRRLSTVFSMVVIVSLLLMSSASAASTTKTLSSNFTLVNLGTTAATVGIKYVKPDGTDWTGSSYVDLTILPDGGQQIVRQYNDTLAAGQGSVVISSSEELGSMVQLLNRGTGAPTSGAYTGFKSGSTKFLLPLVAKKGTSITGLANSQIMVQNVGAAATDVTIVLTALGAASPTYTKPAVTIQPSATFTYDLADETDGHLPVGFWGSAVINAASGGQIVAISNLFFGADGLNTYEGVAVENVTSKWFIPLLYSRLSNTLNTSLSIQNVSNGAPIPVNDLTLSCIKDPTAPASAAATLSIPNATAIPDNGLYTYNTANDTVRFPALWYGGCKISSATNMKFIVMVQYRYLSSPDQGAYIAIPATSTDKTLYVPLVAKRLSNGFATTATIQNLNETTAATVTLIYTDSAGASFSYPGVTIPAGGSIIRNYRQPTTEQDKMPDGWVGTLKVTSDQPIQAYLANTYLPGFNPLNGDQFMAYTGFTKP
jgi:hypothetical protein